MKLIQINFSEIHVPTGQLGPFVRNKANQTGMICDGTTLPEESTIQTLVAETLTDTGMVVVQPSGFRTTIGVGMALVKGLVERTSRFAAAPSLASKIPAVAVRMLPVES